MYLAGVYQVAMIFLLLVDTGCSSSNINENSIIATSLNISALPSPASGVSFIESPTPLQKASTTAPVLPVSRSINVNALNDKLNINTITNKDAGTNVDHSGIIGIDVNSDVNSAAATANVFPAAAISSNSTIVHQVHADNAGSGVAEPVSVGGKISIGNVNINNSQPSQPSVAESVKTQPPEQFQPPDKKLPVNINSQQNSNNDDGADSITTSAPAGLLLQVGNVTVGEACQLNRDTFQRLVQYWPRHCSSLVEAPEDGEAAGNITDTCSESEDLPRVGAAEQEHLSSLSIFLILCILGLCVLLIFCLLKTKLHYLPESVACVIVGALIGLVLKILSSENIANWQKEETFSPTVFFLVILPPIIFESGYNLHKGNFFQNIGSILVFAILGTVVSALVVGGGVYLLGKADVVYPLTFVESFAFGSLISAVDPVATLALFNALQVDPILYMLVFGESILNDAVSIVLTTSVLELASYGDMSAGAAVGYVVWRFCVMFLGSAGIGVLFALLSALTLKHVALRDYTSLELCILIIFIYAPYALAEGIHLSGIMAILFSGVVMSHYTHYNLSPVLQITVQHLMRTLAFTAECIVFIYLGMALFSFKHQFHGALVGWSVVLCLLGRAFNIFPLACLVNRFRDHPITPKMMFVMWFSGLRGAIAYALSLHLEFSDEKRHVLVTTTLFIVLFTIFILGGSVIPLIKYVEVDKKQKNPKNKRKARQKKMLTLSKTREWGQAIDSEHMSELTEEESSEGPRFLQTHQLRGFLRIDTMYLRPFFCRNLTHQEVRSHAHDLKRQCYQSLNVAPSDSEEEMFNLTQVSQT